MAANHVRVLNLEWSPETTLQAEDRCHRPGQPREVHVHYLLSSQTVDEQMWDLVDQKWAAQRAVQDREAQHKTVEAILAEAALANAQLAVAKAVMQVAFRREGATVEEATAKAEEAVEKMAPRFGLWPGPGTGESKTAQWQGGDLGGLPAQSFRSWRRWRRRT